MIRPLISALILVSNLQIYDFIILAKQSQKCKLSTMANIFIYFSSIIDIKIGYSIYVLQQTACLVVNQITVGNFAFLFNCTPVGRTLDS